MGKRRVMKSYHHYSATAYLDINLCRSRMNAVYDGQSEDRLTEKLKIPLGRSG